MYVPGTAVTSLPELHRKFGADPKLVWLPGVVSDCSIIESATGRKQKYVTAAWCYGNGLSKVKQVSVLQTLLKAPDGSCLPQCWALSIDQRNDGQTNTAKKTVSPSHTMRSCR